MAQDSKIEWTHHTFNPWWGCAKVSAGCKNCYADTFASRYGHNIWGVNADRRFFGDKHWNEPLKWNANARTAGERHRVFCASMADVFEDREDLHPARLRLLRLIHDTPHLDWLLLTKRPENIVPALMAALSLFEAEDEDPANVGVGFHDWLTRWVHHLDGSTDYPANVWLGTSVESQLLAYERIPHLLAAPAAVRFLSCEPLIGAVDLTKVYRDEMDKAHGVNALCSGIDWVIVGGESGPRARSMRGDWARALRDQCQEHDVAFHFKQWGNHDEHGKRMDKHAAGRMLDGRTWDEFPTP